MKMILNTKYEAAGFVEALIAIMVVGVASVVLMQIAVRATQNMIQNEVIDIMTQDAVEGATMIQSIATSDGTDVFPTQNSCYIINTDINNKYSFAKDSNNLFVQYTLNTDRNTYKQTAVLTQDNRFFRIFCIQGYTTGDKFVIVRIVVGQTNSDGTITKGNNVKDYSYYTVVKL
jgi:Tfp pilus assembly protein PilV